MTEAINNSQAVYVVDDDSSARSGISKLLFAEGYTVRMFDSAEAFLQHHNTEEVACVVLDLQMMPGLSGLDLQEHLLRDGRDLPIIFVTAHGEVPDSVQAMKQGAIDFLTKPFEPDTLLEAVARAIAKSATNSAARRATRQAKERVDRLTPREYEVMQHVVAGLLNKEIAAALAISEKTVKIHRARVMSKMEVASVADLVRDTQRVGIEPCHSTPE